MAEFAKIYSARESQKAFEKGLAADFRAQRLANAEARIVAGLKETSGEVVRRFLAVPQSGVVVTGWKAFNEKIAQLLIDETAITAAGVDLSNAGDELALECAYYSDRCYPFSTADRDQILAENEDYGTRWAGAFEDIDAALQIRGLAELGAMVLDSPLSLENSLPGKAEPADFAAVKLAQWFIYLRFHQAVKAALDRHGLVNRIPLLVGQNMPGPGLEVVYYPARSLEIVATPKPKLSVEEQKAAAARSMDADIEWQVGRFVSFRSMFAKEATRLDPTMAGYLRNFSAEEEDWKKKAGLTGYAKSWEQSEEQFQNFIAAYRYARAPDKYPPPPSPSPRAGGGSSWPKLFGRKGL